ncbi:hypothetical protein KP509_39G003600 [Ceratopteris richardii]|uniref:Uncharacterized protein n=1 Tax=Ceratopteris richardii TaxID=49495 RepID=A0A8T2PY49_CERRI|nr:hypothetical protein KP509_39G003600 [Ceratopteris richardii]
MTGLRHPLSWSSYNPGSGIYFRGLRRDYCSKGISLRMPLPTIVLTQERPQLKGLVQVLSEPVRPVINIAHLERDLRL